MMLKNLMTKLKGGQPLKVWDILREESLRWQRMEKRKEVLGFTSRDMSLSADLLEANATNPGLLEQVRKTHRFADQEFDPTTMSAMLSFLTKRLERNDYMGLSEAQRNARRQILEKQLREVSRTLYPEGHSEPGRRL